MGWLVTLGVVILLAVIPLGVRVTYDAAGAVAKVIAGPVKITVFPLPKKEKKKKTKKQQKNAQQNAPAGEPSPPEPKPPQPPAPPKKEKAQEGQGGSLLDFLPLVKLALAFLGDFRRKLRLDNLQLKLIMAADDPCDLAVNYGCTWAAVGNLLPQLEKLFVIKKRDIQVECDFTASETLIIARLDVTITLGRLLALVLCYAVRALIQFLKIMKKRKGGAQNESKTS